MKPDSTPFSLSASSLDESIQDKSLEELAEKESSESLAIAPPEEYSDLSPPINSQPETEINQKDNSGEWTIFVSTFGTILLAEIGDKTQVTTLLMTAQSHSPWIVFTGAGSALVLTSLLGVLLGQWLAQRISTKTLEKAAGASLLLIAMTLFWEIFH